MRELNVKDVSRERIPLLWGTVRERMLARCYFKSVVILLWRGDSLTQF